MLLVDRVVLNMISVFVCTDIEIILRRNTYMRENTSLGHVNTIKTTISALKESGRL